MNGSNMTDREALAELVALKDLKAQVEALSYGGFQGKVTSSGGMEWEDRHAECEKLKAEYARRKPLAWAAARARLALPEAVLEPCIVCNALIVQRNSTHYDGDDLEAAAVRAKILSERIRVEHDAPEPSMSMFASKDDLTEAHGESQEAQRLADAFERSADWLDHGSLTGSSRTHPLVGTADYRKACTILRGVRCEARGNERKELAEKVKRLADEYADINSIRTVADYGTTHDKEMVRDAMKRLHAAIDALAAPQIKNDSTAVQRIADAWDAIDPEHKIAVEYSGLFDAISDAMADRINAAPQINAPAGTPALPMESDSNALGHLTERVGETDAAATPKDQR